MRQPPSAGYFRSVLPYNRSGHGPRPLGVFQSLMLENKPQPRLALWRTCTHSRSACPCATLCVGGPLGALRGLRVCPKAPVGQCGVESELLSA